MSEAKLSKELHINNWLGFSLNLCYTLYDDNLVPLPWGNIY